MPLLSYRIKLTALPPIPSECMPPQCILPPAPTHPHCSHLTVALCVHTSPHHSHLTVSLCVQCQDACSQESNSHASTPTLPHTIDSHLAVTLCVQCQDARRHDVAVAGRLHLLHSEAVSQLVKQGEEPEAGDTSSVNTREGEISVNLWEPPLPSQPPPPLFPSSLPPTHHTYQAFLRSSLSFSPIHLPVPPPHTHTSPLTG